MEVLYWIGLALVMAIVLVLVAAGCIAWALFGDVRRIHRDDQLREHERRHTWTSTFTK